MSADGEDKKNEQKEYTPVLHDAFKSFINELSNALRARGLYELMNLYDRDWNDLVERFYKASPFPSAEAVAPMVSNDSKFLALYKELYYRHVHQKLDPTVEDRFDSYQNYLELFNIMLAQPTKDPPIELPVQWIWDLIDEFIFQFQAFHEFRTNVHNQHLTSDDIDLVRNYSHAWSTQTVIRYLHALAKKGGIDLTKKWSRSDEKEDKKDGKASEPNVAPLFTTLSHFSLIGLCRVYCLLGDYVNAVKVLDSIDLTSKRSPFHLAVAAKVTLYYFMGFAYMMLRRYADSVKSFTFFLVYINRNKQAMPRSSYQRAAIEKKIDKIYGLLALANQLAPQNLDESVAGQVRERLRQKTPEQLFEESCPKFISTCPPNYDQLPKPGEENREALELQKKVFLNEFKQRMDIPDIYTYLKMCTNVQISKLAGFLQKSEEETIITLMKLKHKTRNMRWYPGAPQSGGRWISTAEVDFSVDKDVVFVRESRPERSYADFFIRNILKYQDMLDEINSKA